MKDKEDVKETISDAHERFREESIVDEEEENTIDANEKHYRGKGNGLATDEDDLPDRNLSSEYTDPSEYKDEP